MSNPSFAGQAPNGGKRKMPEVRLSGLARQDLLEIWEFIASDNLDAADRVRDTIFRAFERIASMPELGPRPRFANPRLKNVRFWPVPRFRQYLIFYRPIAKGGVEIVRILNGARDIAALLDKPK
jgi:toxin ParE1/3/4